MGDDDGVCRACGKSIDDIEEDSMEEHAEEKHDK